MVTTFALARPSREQSMCHWFPGTDTPYYSPGGTFGGPERRLMLDTRDPHTVGCDNPRALSQRRFCRRQPEAVFQPFAESRSLLPGHRRSLNRLEFAFYYCHAARVIP